jgi:hypothetical protein
MIKKLIHRWKQLCNWIKQYRHRFSDTTELSYTIKYNMHYITAVTESEYESKKQEILAVHQSDQISEVKRIVGVITLFKFDSNA